MVACCMTDVAPTVAGGKSTQMLQTTLRKQKRWVLALLTNFPSNCQMPSVELVLERRDAKACVNRQAHIRC